MSEEYNWVQKYWDLVDQYYWSPNYFRLNSIKLTSLEQTDDHYLLPKSTVRSDRPIYQREGSAEENLARLRRLEEPLNHISDITINLLPDAMRASLFESCFEFRSSTHYVFFGREVRDRFGWGEKNVTQHDGLLVSDTCQIGIEIKTGAATSVDQLVKYAMLFSLVEAHTQPCEAFGLLFLTPDTQAASCFRQCGVDEFGNVLPDTIERVVAGNFSRYVAEVIEENGERIRGILSRMQVRHISWQAFAAALKTESDTLDLSLPGNQTLQKLIIGFRDAILDHPKTKAGE